MDFVEQVKTSVDIVKVVGEYVRLRKAGASRYVGLCPFHNEKTPSFNVSPQLGIFKCFGCGESGDAITFLQKQENVTAVIAFFLLSGQYSSDWGEIMAAALIIVIPVVALFVFMQKRFIEGMAGGSVKG